MARHGLLKETNLRFINPDNIFCKNYLPLKYKPHRAGN